MFIRTDRLLLRPTWGEDRPYVCRLLADAVADSCGPLLGGLLDAEAIISGWNHPLDAKLLVVRHTPSSQEPIGTAGFSRDLAASAEMALWIAGPFRGQGYAMEAALAMIEIAGKGLRLDRVRARYARPNPAAERLLEKLGFRPTRETPHRGGPGGIVPCESYVRPLATPGDARSGPRWAAAA